MKISLSTQLSCMARAPLHVLLQPTRKVTYRTWGFPARHGGTPIAGWLISWKIRCQMDDGMGYPYFRKPPFGFFFFFRKGRGFVSLVSGKPELKMLRTVVEEIPGTFRT